ncbi:MAG: hypothetical protein Q8M39_03410 [Sulfuricurvum sp.]|nr:hypothetical protein [Sulfuricurvum sp.]
MLKYKNTFFKSLSFSYLYISVYLVTGLLTTPMLLNHFQADYFALLMLIYGVITYLNNIRFGLPESLAVLLAKSKDAVFNAYMVKKNFFILCLIVVFTLILLSVAGMIIHDWRIVLGDVYTLNKEDVLNVFYIFIIFALIKIPFDISLVTFIGFHEVYLEKFYKIINPLVNFTLVVFVVYADKNIVFFAFWAGFLDLLVSLVSFIHIYIRYDLIKVRDTTQKIDSIDLLKSGMLFFQLSLTQTLIWGVGIFLVSHILSLEYVTIYSLNMKIYIYILYAYIIVNTVIAPLYGRYFADNSWKDIERIFNLMLLLLPFLGGFIWIGTLYFMSDIIALWTGSQEFYIGSLFVLLMGSFFYFTGYVNSYITLLYSIGEIKSIIEIQWKEVMVNIVVSSISIYTIGLSGLALGMFLAIFLISTRYLPKCIENTAKGKITLNFKIQKKHFLLVLIPNVLVAFIVTNFIDSLLLKSAFFTAASFLYILFSWTMLPPKYKVSMMALLNYKERELIEK